MVNEIKKNSEEIREYLEGSENRSISDMERETNISRGQIRIAVAYLLGADKIKEIKVGMAKVYFLK